MRIPDARAVHRRLLDRGILAGLALADAEPDDSAVADALLVCATELTTDDDIAGSPQPWVTSWLVAATADPSWPERPDERRRSSSRPCSSGRVPAAATGRSASAEALALACRPALRDTPPALPELNEPEVVRHYVNLSQLNFAVDTGSIRSARTMKFNPKLNEWAARLPGFELHPMAPDEPHRARCSSCGARAGADGDQRDARGVAPAGGRCPAS